MKSHKRGGWGVSILCAIACAVSLLPQGAQATNYYWNTGSATWNTNYWSDNPTSGGNTNNNPGAADFIVFNQSTVNNDENVSLAGAISIVGITYNNTGFTALYGNNTTDRPLTIGSGGITMNAGAGQLRFGNGGNRRQSIILGASQSWTNNSSSAFWSRFGTSSGPSTNNLGANALTLAGTGTGGWTFENTIAGTGSITINGGGNVYMSGTNTYSGGTTVNVGILSLQNTSAKPALGTITVVAGAGLGLGVGGTGYFSSVDVDSLWANTLAGVSMNAGSLVGLDTTAGSFTNAYGAGPSTLGLVKLGANTLVLTNAHTYSGPTIISVGTLQLGDGVNDGSMANSSAITNNSALAFNLVGSQTYGNVIAGSGTLTKSGAGTLELSSANTYSGQTTINGGGTLTLSGNRTAAAGIMQAQVGTLNIQNGDFSLGANAFYVGVGGGNATVNHTTGNISFSGGLQLLIGNGSQAGFTSTYNLSGGAITGAASGSAGVRLGVNGAVGAWQTNAFNLSGTGVLSFPAACLMIGRSDSSANNSDSTFNQTGGSATFGTLTMGGKTTGSTNINATLNLTGGTFLATNFTYLSAGDSNTANIIIGGTADVTVGAFPTNRGASATATITFDGGTLHPYAATNAYMGGLNNAFIKAGGIKLDVASGKDITIAQNLLTDAVSTGGGLTKAGVGTLTLSGTNTYTGATTISAGTLTIGTAGQLGSGNYTGVITNNGTLNFDSTATQAVSGAISGSGTVSYTGTGGLNLAGNITGSGSVLKGTGASGDMTLSGTGNDFTGDVGFAASGRGTMYVASMGNGGGNIKIMQNDIFRTTASITTTKGIILVGANQVNNQLYVDSGTLTINGLVTDTTPVTLYNPGFFGFRADGVGTLVLGNDANDFGDRIRILNGTVSVGSIRSNGVASALGKGGFGLGDVTNAINGTININTGTFKYTGTGDTSDRIINLQGTTGGATLDQSGSGLLKFTSDLTASIAGAKTLTLQGSTAGSGELAGAIVDSSGGATALTKAGTGTWTLSGVNTYNGATTVSGGTLNMSGDSLGSGDITVGNTAATKAILNMQGGVVTGGTFIVASSGNAATGVVNHTAGSLVATNDLRVGNGTTGYGEYNLSGGSLTTLQNLNVGQSSNNVGVFNMSAGSLVVGNVMQIGRWGSGATNCNGAFNQSGGTATVSQLVVGGAVSSVGYLNISNGVFNATTFVAMANNNSGTGRVYFGQGSLVTLPAFPTARGANAYADLTFDGGTLSNAAASTTYLQGLDHAYLTANGANFNVGANITVAQAFENAVAQNGKLQKIGPGILTLSGANSYSGGTIISNGTLKVANTTGSLSSSTTVYVDDLGIMDFSGNIQILAGLTGGGLVTNGAGGSLTLNLVNVTNIFGGTLKGASALTLTGGGQLILTGTNSFDGGTLVSNATLAVNGLHNGGVITVISNGFVGGTGLISTLYVGNGGTYAPGNSIATQSVGTLTLTNSGVLEMELGASAQVNDRSIVTNSLTISGGVLKLNLKAYTFVAGASYTIVDWNGASGFMPADSAQWLTLSDVDSASNGLLWAQGATMPVVGGTSSTNLFTINYGDELANGHTITLTAIPEPASINLLVMLGAAYWLRRRLQHPRRSRDV